MVRIVRLKPADAQGDSVVNREYLGGLFYTSEFGVQLALLFSGVRLGRREDRRGESTSRRIMNIRRGL